MGRILIVLLAVLVLAGLPAWGHRRHGGYGPTGVFGSLPLVVLVLVLMGHI